MKFHEDILNGFQVTERTRFCDGRTDGQTTQAKTGGDIKSEAILMSAKNVYFYGEICKITPRLSSNTYLICFTQWHYAHWVYQTFPTPVFIDLNHSEATNSWKSAPENMGCNNDYFMPLTAQSECNSCTLEDWKCFISFMIHFTIWNSYMWSRLSHLNCEVGYAHQAV